MQTFAEAFTQSYPGIVSRIRKRFRSDAEDMAQEVFVKVLKYMERTAIDWNRLPGLLNRITKQVISEKVRNRTGKRVQVLFFNVVELEAVDRRDFVSQFDNTEAVRAVLAALPSKYREVLELRYIQSYTPAEICAILGITHACWNARISRARSGFRRLWRRRYGGV